MTNPCFGCTARAQGCHGTCEVYGAWVAERQERRMPTVVKEYINDKATKRAKRLHKGDKYR